MTIGETVSLDMENKVIITAGREEAGQRLDKLIANKLADTTRSAVQRLIESDAVLLNGSTPNKNYKVRNGDIILVSIKDPTPMTAEPENISLDIVYEDDDLLVVNKPKGMVVHPAAGNYTGTLVNALLWHCGPSLSGINGIIRPGIVHRIDKDTSGLLIVAKNDFAHKHLATQIKEHSFSRQYEAVAYGNFRQIQGTVDAPIGRHPIDRKKMAVTDKNSRNAITHYRVIKNLDGFSHLRLTLETGRTHQIRVHMSYVGHPLAGDVVYGPKKVITELKGQCLHAKMIGFVHPRTEKYIEFESDLPSYFVNFLEKVAPK